MTWGFVALAGATIGGAVISSSASRSAANIQAGASADAALIGLEGLREQLAADKDALDKQIFFQDRSLTQTLAAQARASNIGNYAAEQALNKQLAAQKEALDKTLALQREMFDKQIENLSSYKEAGEAGQKRLTELLGLSGDPKAPGFGSATTAFKLEGFDPKTLFTEFVEKEKTEADPGYAFRLEEGQKAIERSTAAKGGLQSGAALKAAAQYGQSMVSQEYQNAFARSQALFDRFQANKAFQAQEYGNAFNRFTTERGNQLGALQSLQGVGHAAAAGQAAAAGNLGAGGSQAIQTTGAGASTAYGNYGSAVGANAANLGAGTSAAYGNYGNSMSSAFAGSNANRQSAYSANTANQMNAITSGANARSAGVIGSANAVNSAISGLGNIYGMYNSNQMMNTYLNRMPTGSDAAIKENIQQVGVLDNGLGVYVYEYKAPYKDTWGHGEHIGVMAQEVEQIIPEAVSVHPDGYKMVNYSMIH